MQFSFIGPGYRRQSVHLSRQGHIVGLRPGQTLNNLEPQAGFLADQLQQIGSDSLVLSVLVYEFERNERRIDAESNDRMFVDEGNFILRPGDALVYRITGACNH